MSSYSSSSRFRSTHLTTTQGVTATSHSRNLPTKNKGPSHIEPPKDSSEVSFEEGFSIFAFGDLSMSEAYNAPAPTTGEYPLRLKRTRPPKASKKHLQLQLQHGENGGEDEDGGDMEDILQHLYKPDYPLSPASDFKRFVEGLQSAKVASHASTGMTAKAASPTRSRMTSIDVGKPTNAQSQAGLVGSTGDEAKASKALQGSLATPLQAGIPTLSPASDFTGLQSAHSKTVFPSPFLTSSKTASPALTRTTGASVSKRTQAQGPPVAGVKTSMALQRDVDAKSSSVPVVVSKARARDRVTTGHSVLIARA